MSVVKCSVCNEQGHSARMCKELSQEIKERPVPYVESGGYREDDGEEDSAVLKSRPQAVLKSRPQAVLKSRPHAAALQQRWIDLYHLFYTQSIHIGQQNIPYYNTKHYC